MQHNKPSLIQKNLSGEYAFDIRALLQYAHQTTINNWIPILGGATIAFVLLMPLLGKGEGFISPVMGLDKFQEIIDKSLAETGKRYYPWVKQTFNISVEDAIGAVKFVIVAGTLQSGP